jgi:hypothetical protein
MRKLLFVFLIIFTTYQLTAQVRIKFNVTLKDRVETNWPVYTGFFVGGALNGFEEVLTHHYYSFKSKFPKANDSYWDPRKSWVNKWEAGNPANGEKFLLSSTALVWTTDAYHLTRTLKNASYIGSVGFMAYRTVKSRKKPTIWDYALDFVLLSAAHTAGFNLIYDGIF